jgi:hypothetical protein
VPCCVPEHGGARENIRWTTSQNKTKPCVARNPPTWLVRYEYKTMKADLVPFQASTEYCFALGQRRFAESNTGDFCLARNETDSLSFAENERVNEF